VIGTIARGLVVALVGVLVMGAAITHKASESGGIDKALVTLRGQPFGELLMMLAALGLVVFGTYGTGIGRSMAAARRRDWTCWSGAAEAGGTGTYIQRPITGYDSAWAFSPVIGSGVGWGVLPG
jgi:hypothetical protein